MTSEEYREVVVAHRVGMHRDSLPPARPLYGPPAGRYYWGVVAELLAVFLLALAAPFFLQAETSERDSAHVASPPRFAAAFFFFAHRGQLDSKKW